MLISVSICSFLDIKYYSPINTDNVKQYNYIHMCVSVNVFLYVGAFLRSYTRVNQDLV